MNAPRPRSPGKISRYWVRARTEPGLLRNLIAIAVMILLGTATAGYFLANQRFNPPWEDKYTVYATFDETPAVSPGNGQEVRIYGVAVGDIRSASVSDRGQAVLQMRIDDRYKVYDNARAVLRPKSVLNEMYVELNPGGPPGRQLGDGAVLPAANTARPIQVNEALTNLDDNARYALTSLLEESDTALAHAPSDLPSGLHETDKVLADLQPVTVELRKRKEGLARLVTALSRVSAAAGADDERTGRLARSLQRTLDTVATGSKDFDAALAQLPELSTSLRGATDAVTKLSDQLDPTLDNVRSASDELPEALSRLNESVKQVDHTLDFARPVLDKAIPVVRDMRPAVGDIKQGLDALEPTTDRLDPITSGVLPYLSDLQAFVYQTNSVVSLTDANRGILRGQFSVSPDTLPVKLPAPRSAQPPRR